MTSTVAPRALEHEAEAIRAASARWLQAADTRDPNRVASFYADDGSFLVPNVPLARGRDAVRAVWTQLLSAPNLSLVWTPSSVEVAQSADMAYEIGSYQLGMDAPNGRIEDEGKYLVVWRKYDRDWQVAADIFNSSRAPSQ
jgi:uncharacterized protein (TIGR02246 family)